jgi:hypothetical protein
MRAPPGEIRGGVLLGGTGFGLGSPHLRERTAPGHAIFIGDDRSVPNLSCDQPTSMNFLVGLRTRDTVPGRPIFDAVSVERFRRHHVHPLTLGFQVDG